VDEVVPRTPYVMTPAYLDWIIETYKIDYVVHGDDPCIGPDGRDVYEDVKNRGMFKTIPRTEGVSTTEIVGRMLLMSTHHHLKSSPGENEKNGLLVSDPKFSTASAQLPFGYRESRFLTTSRMLRLFSQPPPRPIEKGMKVVYINGGWDMFHAGHASILKKAKALGDYLLVGV
jgi:ethanolamine-phosphate cytidylyltransferase